MRSRLVIAPNWIGDCVMALPVVRALKRSLPAGRLVVLAKRNGAPIFKAEPSVDRVLSRSGTWSDARALRKEGLDEAWLLPNSLRAALIAFLAAVPERIGHDTDGRGLLLTHSVPVPPRTEHQLRDYDDLLLARGIEPDSSAPRLTPPDSAIQRAGAALEHAGLAGQAPRLILLAPGAAFGPTKRWPAERFGQLVAALAARGFACACAIGPGERALGERVAAAAGVTLPLLGSDLDVVELAAVMARARLVVANDSGAAHLAGAVGTPVVVFFGPTDPGRTRPTGSPTKVLDRYVFCSPCFLKTCPYGHECMKEIEVADAVRAVEDLLGG
jgi:lipopolysaccharide heptosyltransferase II